MYWEMCLFNVLQWKDDLLLHVCEINVTVHCGIVPLPGTARSGYVNSTFSANKSVHL